MSETQCDETQCNVIHPISGNRCVLRLGHDGPHTGPSGLPDVEWTAYERLRAALAAIGKGSHAD